MSRYRDEDEDRSALLPTVGDPPKKEYTAETEKAAVENAIKGTLIVVALLLLFFWWGCSTS